MSYRETCTRYTVAPAIDCYCRMPSSSRILFSGWLREASGPAPGVKAGYGPSLQSAGQRRPCNLSDRWGSFLFRGHGLRSCRAPWACRLVRHLETIHKLFLEPVQERLVPAQYMNVIYVQRKKDKAGVLVEHVNARVRFERAGPILAR